jgi:DNA-directed RNA polymerase subunit RPC12/RpoP
VVGREPAPTSVGPDRSYFNSTDIAVYMPACAVCGEAGQRSEPLLPFRSHDRTMALTHRGCEAGERLPFLLREGGVTRATYVCEDCTDDVRIRHVEVTGAQRERDTRKQFRCPACGTWARYDEG